MIRKLALCLFLISTFLLSQSTTSAQFDGKSWWGYVKVLAGDDMEGRETGSEGLRKASAFVIDQLKKNGLEPAGNDGFYQPVKLRSRQIVEDQSSLALVRNGKTQPLVLGDDAMFSTRVELAPNVEAPLVFVGYGLRVPEMQYDDLAGLDLKGKVAVLLVGSPEQMPSALASHYQSLGERWKGFEQAGVIGIITIQNPAAMDIPWERQRLARTRPSMSLADPALDDAAGEKLAVIFNPARAQKLFEGTGHSFDEIAALGKNRKPLPHFALNATIKAHATMNTKEVDSANIVAKLPGSDPALKNEYVVLSAHLDHLGIGEPIHGDPIYNGAMDNASGSAVLLDTAASLKRSSEKMKRSVLFLFLTAEEKGLLGSKYFAAHPTAPAESMIANINIDMFLPIFPLKLLTVYGLAESDLGDVTREVAQSQGLRVQPDPEPLRNAFIRSDQYNFIRHGIPAVAMKVGFEKGSPEEKLEHAWLTERYHAPSDDLDQPVDLAAAGKYEDVISALLITVSNSDRRPQWKQDSFFRRFAEHNRAGGSR
ncbi:MAG TPA: M28 family metallopeptidase [Terriglobales bacterium]|nr:M28 family metallopeptidase [Terriglobales bacterium]